MKKSQNYLDKVPMRNAKFKWSVDKDGAVALEVENKGVFNRIAQKLLKKPPVTFVHLDKMGTFIWPLLDGKLTVGELGEKVREEFGDEAEPLYERLVKYFGILQSYGFIVWNE